MPRTWPTPDFYAIPGLSCHRRKHLCMSRRLLLRAHPLPRISHALIRYIHLITSPAAAAAFPTPTVSSDSHCLVYLLLETDRLTHFVLLLYSLNQIKMLRSLKWSCNVSLLPCIFSNGPFLLVMQRGQHITVRKVFNENRLHKLRRLPYTYSRFARSVGRNANRTRSSFGLWFGRSESRS